MLLVVSGPDRVGKSTLIKEIEDVLDPANCVVYHHGAPDPRSSDVFARYREEVGHSPEGKHIIFDRAWPCTFILEQLRKRNTGHFDALIDLEIWMNEVVEEGVLHIGQLRPWHWSAPLHMAELKEQHPGATDWYIRDKYIERMQEHKQYTEQLMDFYEDVTMFPNITLTETVDGHEVVERCKIALRRSGF